MQIFEKIRYHFFTREFVLFLIIGCINTFNGTFLAWLCSFLIADSNIAFNLGYITSNFLAYWMNSRFIFHKPLLWQRYIKFAISYIPNYLIQNMIVLIFYNLLGFPAILSYIIAAILGIPVTFLAVKLFAFRHT